MKALHPSSWFRVESLDMAHALVEPQTQKLLSSFMTQEQNIKVVADELDLTLNQTLYRVRRLVRLGLLQVTREEKRKGRAIKYYQAIAERFFIPYSSSPFNSIEEWLLEDNKEREKQMVRYIVKAGLSYANEKGFREFGKRVFFRKDGIFETDFAYSPSQEADMTEMDAPAVSHYFLETTLTPSEAKSLQLEINKLVQNFEKRGQGQRYLLRLGLAPLFD